MKLTIARRAMLVRQNWKRGVPPALTRIDAVLRHRNCDRNTADIADAIGCEESEVAAICIVDQDNRFDLRPRAATA